MTGWVVSLITTPQRESLGITSADIKKWDMMLGQLHDVYEEKQQRLLGDTFFGMPYAEDAPGGDVTVFDAWQAEVEALPDKI
jgi:hypothetical protein